MAAKTSWHRYGKKLRHCHRMYVSRFHEDAELDTANDKYNVWYKHGLAMLNIHEVDMDDVGQYACVATNRLGACTTVGELNIQGSRLISGFESLY